MDRYELINKIKKLEGLTDEEKSALLGLLRSHKKYGLVWEDKPEEAETELKEKLPVLKEIKERAIINDTDTKQYPNHILIEGENLHALTVLSYTHADSIDVIYIDPPYNTGKKDEFKYNDSWVDSEDSYRHSKWLSFINKRLRLAKKLLSPSGMIFISIDDNEIGQLKVLCDEIFSHDSNPENSNCLGVLIWDLGSGTSAGHFTRAHEYVLAYCNNKKLLPNFTGGEGIIDDRAIKKKSIKNDFSNYRFKKGTKFEAPEGTEFKGEWGGTEITKLISGRMICHNGKLAEDVTLCACWTQRNQMDSFFEGKDTVDSKGQHVIEFYFRENGKLYCRKDRSKINPPSVLREIATTKQGSTLLKEMFNGEEPIGFVKPINLLKYLISLGKKKAQVLDFFAGSGSTLHAIMQLNAEDDGNRTAIICTNNENKICEEVTYVRGKEAIEGYTTPKGKKVEGLHCNNLRYYKTDFVDRKRTVKNMRALVSATTDMLCIKENMYNEVESFGTQKKLPTFAVRHFTDNKGGEMLIIYDETIIPDLVDIIYDMEMPKPIKIYVFSPNHNPYTDEFEDVEEKVELCALPAAIYDAYREVIPPANNEELKVTENTEKEEKQ